MSRIILPPTSRIVLPRERKIIAPCRRPIRRRGGSAELVSIAVTPANMDIGEDDQQLTATGTYSDSSTADITAEVTWGSDFTVEMNPGGLCVPVGEGPSAVTATLGEIVGSTTITAGIYSAVVLADSPLLAWRNYSEVGGLHTVDFSGNNNHGIVTGELDTDVFLSEGETVLVPTTYQALSAPNIIETTANIRSTNVPAVGGGGAADIFSVEWILVNNNGFDSSANGIGNAGASWMAKNSGGTRLVSITQGGGAAYTTGTYLSRGHYVFTYDGTSARFYRDGALVFGPTAKTAPGAMAFFGWNTNGAGFGRWDGIVDRISLYPSVLAADRVSLHYERCTNGI